MNKHDENWAVQIALGAPGQRLDLTPKHVLERASQLALEYAIYLESLL